jgi:FkbM family methyltransferase
MIVSGLRDKFINLLRPHWFRGKGRILNVLVPHRGERSAVIFGNKMQLDLGDYIQRNIFLGTYEPAETAILKKKLKKGFCFVDIGANVGYFTALAASIVGSQGTVIAVEPSPYAFNRLKNLVDQNKLRQVKLLSLGLSCKSGEKTLFLNLESHLNHAPTMISHPGGIPQTVLVRTLDAILLDEGVHHVDLLKIDIEGYEMIALSGAIQSLSNRKIKAIICEFNDYWLRAGGSSPQELYNFLLGYGYYVPSGEPQFSRDSVTTHFFKLKSN